MFYCNPKKMFELRNIANPYATMVKWGLSYNTAWRIYQGQVSRIDLAHIERLCINLNCTPNDIIEWYPQKDAPKLPNHPLQALRPKTDAPSLGQMLSDFPVEKLEELGKFIQEQKAQKEG